MFLKPCLATSDATLLPSLPNLLCCSLEHLKNPYKLTPANTSIVKAIIALVIDKVINLNKNSIAHPPPFTYKEVQNTDLSAVASSFSFLLSKIHTSFPSFLTSFHHLNPTKNLPLMFFVIQKSTEPNKITDKYTNPFCFVKKEIIIYITNEAILKIKVKKQMKGWEEFL